MKSRSGNGIKDEEVDKGERRKKKKKEIKRKIDIDKKNPIISDN